MRQVMMSRGWRGRHLRLIVFSCAVQGVTWWAELKGMEHKTDR
jgi:hypothetical protein